MTCPFKDGCLYAVGYALLWWVGASTLLYFSWNKVVTALTTAKQAKFWHALLVVATLAAFCMPRYCMKKGRFDCHKDKQDGYHHFEHPPVGGMPSGETPPSE